MDPKPQRSSTFGPKRLAIAAGLAILAGLAAVYLTDTPSDNGNATVTATTAPKAGGGGEKSDTDTAASKLNTGEVKAFVYKTSPMAITDIAFLDGKGAPTSLSSFKGKTVLLNLWATWCAPCRHEMPSLDRLEGRLGSDDFEVVALSLDRAGLDASQEFLDEISVKHLKTYAEPITFNGALALVVGMPTTILIDPEGREVGRLIGPAEWDSEDAVNLVQSVIDPPKT